MRHDAQKNLETEHTLLDFACSQKVCTRKVFLSAGACVKSEPGVSDRAYPSRDCLPGGESQGEEVGSGRARGEQTGKSTASALASASYPLYRRTRFSKCLWRMSARQTIPWEKALWLGKRRISRSQTIARRLFYRRSFSPSLPSKDAHTVKFMPPFRLVLILFDKWRGSKKCLRYTRDNFARQPSITTRVSIIFALSVHIISRNNFFFFLKRKQLTSAR